MRVIITGAAGFLGSHLALYHVSRGDHVLGLDNFSSSKPGSRHLNELIRLGCMFEDCDITTDQVFMHARAFTSVTGGVDRIYNFACPASPPIYQSIPVETLMTCVVGTKNVLDIARFCKSVVVHASTSEVYGDPSCSPQDELYRGNVNSYGPRSCYDEGKRAAEALMFDYLHKHGVDARLVRIFNTYGPNMDPNDGRVVSNFICQALRGEKLTIYGDGSQTRSFCYVDDLISGIVALGDLPANPMTPINLGNPVEFTMKQLAQHVIYHVKAAGGGMPSDLNIDQFVTYKDLPTDDPTQRRPDISLAWSLLKWKPSVHLATGILRTVPYFASVV